MVLIMMRVLRLCLALVLLSSVASSQPIPNPSTPWNVANFPGATAGDKISACVAALPSTGGVCDARSLPSGGTIPAITLDKSGATVLGPCGSFTVTGSIQIYNAAGLTGFEWKGCGAGYLLDGTNFDWAGNSTDPMFRIRGVAFSKFGNFSITSGGITLGTSNTTALGNAVLHFANVPATIVPGMTLFDSTTGTRPDAGAGIDTFATVMSVVPGVNGTVTMTANAINSGVGNGDIIVFSTLKAGVQFETAGSVATARILDNIYMQGVNGGIVDGVLWCTGSSIGFQPWSWCNNGGSGPDQNNDDDLIQNVTVTNYSRSAFHMTHTQTTQQLFFHSFMNSDGFAPYGFWNQGGGGFTFTGGSGGNNSVADFRLDGVIPFTTITSFDSEGSARFIDTGGTPGQGIIPIIVVGGRFSANNPAADGKIIRYSQAGPLTVTGMDISSGNTSITMDIAGNAASYGTAIGNTIATIQGVTGFSPFTCGGSSLLAGNCWNLTGNTMTSQPQANASITRIGTTATVTTTAPHGWPLSSVCGCTYTAFINTTTPSDYTIFGATITVTSTTTFTYTVANTATTPASVPGVTNLVGTFGVLNISAATGNFPFLKFAQLPTCNTSIVGVSYWITDQATARAYYGAVTGGGAIEQWVTCGDRGSGPEYYQGK